MFDCTAVEGIYGIVESVQRNDCINLFSRVSALDREVNSDDSIHVHRRNERGCLAVVSTLRHGCHISLGGWINAARSVSSYADTYIAYFVFIGIRKV
jgi:hypothetical protein